MSKGKFALGAIIGAAAGVVITKIGCASCREGV